MIKILVIGETCKDVFIYCDANRLSPEAPVPVLNPIREVVNNGMSGNVVENLKAIRNDIEITQWSQKELITKVRYVDDKTNHLFIRVDSGEESITPFKYDLDEVINFDIVIVSDYNKGFLNNESLEEIGKKSKLSILDSKRNLRENIINSYTFVKLNEHEASLNQRHIGNDNLIITLGKKGCMFNAELYPSPKPQETIDVSGAGDTFTSAFILKYFETKNVNDSLIFANEKSSFVVSKRGVVTP